MSSKLSEHVEQNESRRSLTMAINKNEASRQLYQAGYSPYVMSIEVVENHVTGRMDLGVIDQLTGDPRFANGVLYSLHRNVGEDLRDFRSYRGSFGKGSLQIVLDVKTGAFYADVDQWNPYADLIGFVMHGFVEVLPMPWKRQPQERTA